MGVSDRLYEAACECRDLETRVDRLSRDLTDKTAELAERARAERALLAELEGHPLPAGAQRALLALAALNS